MLQRRRDVGVKVQLGRSEGGGGGECATTMTMTRATAERSRRWRCTRAFPSRSNSTIAIEKDIPVRFVVEYGQEFPNFPFKRRAVKFETFFLPRQERGTSGRSVHFEATRRNLGLLVESRRSVDCFGVEVFHIEERTRKIVEKGKRKISGTFHVRKKFSVTRRLLWIDFSFHFDGGNFGISSFLRYYSLRRERQFRFHCVQREKHSKTETPRTRERNLESPISCCIKKITHFKY